MLSRALVIALILFSVCANPIYPQYLPLSGGTLTGTLNGPTINDLLYVNQWCTGDDQTCVTNALTNIGTSSKTLVVTRPITLSSDLTIPANVDLQIENGGGFIVPSNSNLVISGPLSAGLYQIFFGGISNVYFYGGAVANRIYPQWFGATGHAKTAGFTGSSGSSTINLGGQYPFVNGDLVTLVGGGVSGANLQTTVTDASNPAQIILATALGSDVIQQNPIYNEDDSAALNAWTNSVRGGAALGLFYDVRNTYGPSKLYLPKGFYSICSQSVLVYSSTVMEAEQSGTNTGGTLIQCNPSIPALRISANNFDPTGRIILNYGNGNSYFSHLGIRGGFPRGDQNAVAVQYLNAANVHSDNRWDHPFFERLNGYGIGVGYETSLVGSYGPGSTTVTLADGSTFCSQGYATPRNFNCSNILIVGGGPNGTNLQTNITSMPDPAPTQPGGQPFTVTISPGIGNASEVTNPKVYPVTDIVGGLYIEHAELDVGVGLFGVGNSGTGDVTIEQAEVFYATHGAVNADSLRPFGLRFTDSLCYGCGTAQSSIAKQSHSIYWLDASNSQTNDVVINNVRFECSVAQGTAGSTCATASSGLFLVGGIYINGARSVELVNNQLYDADNNSQYKSALIANTKNVNVSGNTFFYDRLLTDWSSSVALNLSSIGAAHVVNNKFINNSPSNIPTAVNSDYPIPGSVFQGNLFQGQISQQFNSNIANTNVRNLYQDEQHIQKYGGSVPVNGSWNQGDIIWNSTPSVGSPAGWICIVSGTPGTWASFGTITSP